MASVYPLWICFILGQLLYILKRAYYSVNGPNTPVTEKINTYKMFLISYWIPLFVRGVLGVFIFWVVMFYPDLFTKITQYLGLNINLTIPKVPPVAFLLGLGSDFILDWIVSKVPFLQGTIPDVGGK